MAHEPKEGRSSIRLGPMDVPKASDVLADELRERILSGEFSEDAPLPPERELVTQTEMSRSTVREALRILEVQGLVRIKAGRAGGAFIQRPSGDSVATSVNMVIRGQQIRVAALHETREGIEPFCAKLAAQHRTDEDLKALDAANEEIADESGTLASFLQANVDWHVGVATASHNELLTGFMSALSQAIYAATENETFVDQEVRRLTVKAHYSVTRAIRSKDPAAALRRMQRHVHSYGEAIQEIEERTEISVPNTDQT